MPESPSKRPPAHLADLEPGCNTLEQARDFVNRLCRHYENFSLASIFLPMRFRPALRSIYAFARFSDDLADETPPLTPPGMLLTELRRRRLTHWLGLLDGLPATANRHPILFSLEVDARLHQLPLDECRLLLLAFLQDQDAPDYPDDAALWTYCRHSAAPVGRLLLALNGITAERGDFSELARLSDKLCAGLQLANFWQDLSRDLPAGRLYVPRERLARHGLPADPNALLEACHAAGPLLQELVALARTELLEGVRLADALPWRFALEVRMFAGGGLAILSQVERLGTAVLRTRPSVSAWRKAMIGLTALRPFHLAHKAGHAPS